MYPIGYIRQSLTFLSLVDTFPGAAYFAAAFAGLGVFPALPIDRHRLRRKPRLHPERAARALLAREAMADGDANRFAARQDGEISAAARCLTVVAALWIGRFYRRPGMLAREVAGPFNLG